MFSLTCKNTYSFKDVQVEVKLFEGRRSSRRGPKRRLNMNIVKYVMFIYENVIIKSMTSNN